MIEAEDAQQIGIYYVDAHNFPNVQKAAKNGDALARDLCAAMVYYMDHKQPDCGICHKSMRHGAASNGVTFIIVLAREYNTTLTLCICEACTTRDDLDDMVAQAIRHWWPKLSDSDEEITMIEIIDPMKVTLH